MALSTHTSDKENKIVRKTFVVRLLNRIEGDLSSGHISQIYLANTILGY